VRYFASVAKVLRPGGRIAIVDFDGRGWAIGMSGHYTPIATAKKEMAEAGYRLVKEADFLEKQFLLVFAR
jgi:arsenite methyltransferase